MSNTNPHGEIIDYVIKIEFQMRGSSHGHCLLWVKDAPKLGQDSDEEVCTFIDNYISESYLVQYIKMNMTSSLWKAYHNTNILTIVKETNLVILVSQSHLQHKH